MDCIRCGGEMDKRPERGVLIDYCRPCNAVWLDAGELEALEVGAERPEEHLAAQHEAETARERDRAVTALGLCPRCQRELRTRHVHGVEVDQCGGCGGIFFDRGELPVVLDKSRGVIRTLRRHLRRPGGRGGAAT
jgi:Zn-finger nucleic acid-binding protein